MLLERTQIKCRSRGGSCWFGEGPRTPADGTQPKKPAPSSPAASQTASLCPRTLGIVFSSLPPPCPSSTAPDPTSILPGSITHGIIDPQTRHCGWRCHGRIPNLPLCLQSVTSHPLLPNTVSNSLLAGEQPVPCQNTQGATVPAGMPAAADSALACLLPSLLPSLPVLGDSSPRGSAASAR